MTAIDEKGLPCNLDAERFVLGSILMDDSQFVHAACDISAEDFSLEKHHRFAHIFGGDKIGRSTTRLLWLALRDRTFNPRSRD